MNTNTPKVTLESTLKSLDTEEWLDLKFYRPIGYYWALLFRRLGITPNAVSVASIFIGAASAFFFFSTNIYTNIVGIVLLIWANTYDSADGQLARMTGQYSQLGRVLDGMSSDIWFVCIYISICSRLALQGWGIAAFFLGAVAGYFHVRQAAMSDRYRNFHLYILKGKSGSELDDYEQLSQHNKQLTWKHNFLEKYFMFFYVPYTRGQEAGSPSMQHFRKVLAEKYPNEISPRLREEFLQKSRPLMKYTNILTFNTRTIVLCLSLLFNVVWVFLLFELTVLNVIFIYMVTKHERMCARFATRVEKGDFV